MIFMMHRRWHSKLPEGFDRRYYVLIVHEWVEKPPTQGSPSQADWLGMEIGQRIILIVRTVPR